MLQTAKALARILPNDCRENSKIYRIYFPHAISLLQNINVDCDTLDVATICLKIAVYTGRMANYSQSLPHAQRAHSIRVRLLGEEHIDTLFSMDTLSTIYAYNVLFKNPKLWDYRP